MTVTVPNKCYNALKYERNYGPEGDRYAPFTYPSVYRPSEFLKGLVDIISTFETKIMRYSSCMPKHGIKGITCRNF